MKVQIIKCDSCGRELAEEEVYRPIVCKHVQGFWNGVERVYDDAPKLDLCLKCATDLVESVRRIRKHLKQIYDVSKHR